MWFLYVYVMYWLLYLRHTYTIASLSNVINYFNRRMRQGNSDDRVLKCFLWMSINYKFMFQIMVETILLLKTKKQKMVQICVYKLVILQKKKNEFTLK